MSDIAHMRRVLGKAGGHGSPLAAEESAALLAGHTETTNIESVRELKLLETALRATQAEREAVDEGRTGRAALSALRLVGRSLPGAAISYAEITRALAMCTTLDPPEFTMQSADGVTRNEAGNVITFTRARAAEKTLELSAVVGEFGGVRWPSSESFILGWNRSQASIGGVLSIPTHGEGTLLTVTAQLRVEQIQFDGSITPGDASSLLATIHGDGRLPLRGAAVGWCNAGLSLHGANGSARTALKFVSEWANRDGAESIDQAPGGVISLSNTVALQPETSSLSVFVDAEAFSGAEESEEMVGGFTAFECRGKPVQEINGIWLPPSRLRLAEVSALLCQIPILRQREPHEAAT